MKIAVGIMAIALSLVVLFQSLIMFGVVGPDYLEITEETMIRGGAYMLLAVLIFVGAAFSFALPKVAIALFGLGFIWPKLTIQTGDIHTWGTVSLFFGILLFADLCLQRRKNKKIESNSSEIEQKQTNSS